MNDATPTALKQGIVPADSDEALRRRFAGAGEQAAFTTLVRRHSRLVWSTARRRCGSDADADEVAQDVFVVLARKASGLRAEGGFGPWLHRVTVIVSAKRASRMALHRRRQDAFMKSMIQSAEAAVGETQDADRERLACLDEALDRLPGKERSILIWRHLEGMNLAEIASRLGKSEAAVQKRGERALARLRRVFSRLVAAGCSGGGALSALRAAGGDVGGPSAETVASWSHDALRRAVLPAGFSFMDRVCQWWHRLPWGKWPMTAATVVMAIVAAGYLIRLQTGAARESDTLAAIPKTSVPAPPRPWSPTSTRVSAPTPSDRPPIEPALIAERERRRSARRALHLAMLADRLGLDAAQQAESARLYDEHHVIANHMLGRQGRLVLEVPTNEDSYGMGSLGPLSTKRLGFEAAITTLLRPDQVPEWTRFQDVVRQNAINCRLSHYLGYWSLIAGETGGDPEVAKSYFADLATDDIARHGGVTTRITEGAMKGGTSFHWPPFYEFHEEAAAALPVETFRRFRKLVGIAAFASQPETFRANLVTVNFTPAILEEWSRHLGADAPNPRGRAQCEIGDLYALMILPAEQARGIEAALIQRAQSEAVDSWPGFVPASDEEFLERRSRDLEFLGPLLTSQQMEVLRTAPLVRPFIGEGYTHSARWDARAE